MAKGVEKNKTCKSKNVIGAARVCDCGGHSQNSPCGDTGGLQPPCHNHTHTHPPPAMGLGSGYVLSTPGRTNTLQSTASATQSCTGSCSQAEVTPAAPLRPQRPGADDLLLEGTPLPNPRHGEPGTAPRLLGGTLHPQLGNCSHAVGVLCFAFPSASKKGH